MKNHSQMYRISLPLAIEEANELLNHAIDIDKSIQELLLRDKAAPPLGKVITANILIGLSIEIFLKCFMLAGRDEGIKMGHKLLDLYKVFPDFLKKEIENRYKVIFNNNSTMQEFALIISQTIPDNPNKNIPESPDFKDFVTSLNVLSNIFVDSRYFFEKINDDNWSIIGYYFESAKSIAIALKLVLDDYMAGKFKGNAKSSSY
jgi:hypothetical protein